MKAKIVTPLISRVVTWELRELVSPMSVDDASAVIVERRIISNRRISDMLRYDFAFANDERPGIVVTLQYRDRHGSHRPRVTTDRWKSFGVIIVPGHILSVNPVITEEVMRRHAETWYTMQHEVPNTGFLVRRTFAEFLAGSF